MQTQMTVSEALAAGYEKCIKDGECIAEDIDDVDPEKLEGYQFWILEKESRSYQISANEIKQMVIDHVADQDEVADEDGELCDLVEEIPESEFEALSKRINESLAKNDYWPATQIQLLPDPEDPE